jgi:PRTRC genetic system protein E
MFQELMPLLAQRLLLLTLSRVSDEQISINVIPKPLKSDQSDDDGALTTPLSVTGTPRDLDEQLPGQLVAFVEAHLGLSSTLKSAKEQMENAGRAAKEAARKSTASKSSGGSSRSVGSSSTQIQAGVDTKESPEESSSSRLPLVVPGGGEATDIGARTGSLFDTENHE